MKQQARLASLDALRGFDMFFIIGGATIIKAFAELFPNSSVADFAIQQMTHVDWHGFAFYDMIFPLFLFIAGVSFPFSLEKSRATGRTEKQIILTILKRAFKLILLGLIINKALSFNFPIRFASVLGRIGVAWMVGALIYVIGGRKWSVIMAAALLVVYYFLCAFVPNPLMETGQSIFSAEGSIVCWFDVKFLPGLVLNGNYDPEGILSTIPAISTALLGILMGVLLKEERLNQMKKVYYMLGIAVALVVIGLLWSMIFPINKKLWTSSYVCFAGGLSVFLLAIFYFIMDVKQWRKWAFPFTVIGLNSITIYVAQRVFNFHHATNFLGGGVVNLFPVEYRTTVYSILYFAVVWSFLYFLYRKKVFIKV